MNLIDRYVTEVGKQLPRKNKLDIEAELRSTLEDMLEDRREQAQGQTDEALVEEILKEYGAPKEVARTYQTHQFLIGPSLFNIYILVLKIVLAALTLGLTIATAFAVFGNGMTTPELFESLVKFGSNLINALIVAFGNVTLVFAILERVLPASELEEKEDWSPAELTKEPDPDHVSRGESFASILFTAAGLILLNFYPEIIGVWNMQDGEWVRFVTLSEAFFRYLPWINLGGILTIALNIWTLRQSTWTTTTRWLQIGLQVFAVGVAIAILREPNLIAVAPNLANMDEGNILVQIFSYIIPISLIIVIVVNTIEIVKDTIRLMKPGKPAYPFEK